MRRFFLCGLLLATACSQPDQSAASPDQPGNGLGSSNASSKAAAFFAVEAHPGDKLAADGYWPQGRRFVYMGYSGKPADNLQQGFTVAGPVYGNQQPYLDQCAAAGWPVVAHVSLHLNFVKGGDAAKYDEAQLRLDLAAQIARLAPMRNIVWWAVSPEELRPWKKDEMRYLQIVSDSVRALDPLKRPIYLYNPNHRDAATLKPIAPFVDILAKGAYVNSAGYQDQRGWVRWSVEQELQAIRDSGASAQPLLMPELCKDPDPAGEALIRPWVRHDVYLGLCAGAKGVLIWSLFPRKEVKRTYAQWLAAYGDCGRELTGPRHLGEVFLYGRPRQDLKVTPLQVQQSDLILAGKGEENTASPEELKRRKTAGSPFTSAEFSLAGHRYLFVVNSTAASASFRIDDIPAGAHGEDAFTGMPIAVKTSYDLKLPPWGVWALKLSPGQP